MRSTTSISSAMATLKLSGAALTSSQSSSATLLSRRSTAYLAPAKTCPTCRTFSSAPASSRAASLLVKGARPHRVSAVHSRGLTTTARRSAISDWLAPRLGGALGRAVFGRRKERENQRQRGGLMPEEARKLEQQRQREAAQGAFSSDGEGESLFDDVENESGVMREQARDTQRESAKRAARAARKRWGARDPVTGVVAEEHKYSTATFRISPRKLNMLARQISGKPIDLAILQMQFSPKRAARRVRATLALARDHAAEKGLDVTRLIVDEAWVGKGRYLVRADIKGRARMGKLHHPSARLSVVLRYGKTWEQQQKEQLAEAVRRVKSIGTGGVSRVQRPVVNVHQRPGFMI